MNQETEHQVIDVTQTPFTHILYNGHRHNEFMDEAGRETIENVAKALMPIAEEIAHWENAYIQLHENGTFTINDGFPAYLMTQIMSMIH